MSEERFLETQNYVVKTISVDQIETGSFQTGVHLTDERLRETAVSIRKMGYRNPISVFQRSDCVYELVTGKRRFFAVRDILGWATISVILLKLVPRT